MSVSLDPARYAIGGSVPRVAVRPASRAEAAEAIRSAARDGLGVAPWGGGVALPFEAAPRGYDVAIDLTALDGIIEYEPADLTLTAECGVTISSLRAALAAHGQELPLEAAHATRATLGGVLAANASGPRRRAFGAPRDRILGARALLGDGSIARTGGKVVKNVAGYGLHRLMCGSRGGLAIILEASLKLQPAPASRVALVYGADAALLADRARWAPFARLEPAALTVMTAALAADAFAGNPVFDTGGAPFVAVVGFEADAPWAAEQERETVIRLGPPRRRIEGPEVAALWDLLADLEERPGCRLTCSTPDCSPAALVPLVGGCWIFHAPAGRLHVWPGDGAATSRAESLVAAGWVPLAARGVSGLAPALPPLASVEAMRRAVREAIDPGNRFAGGEAWARGWF